MKQLKIEVCRRGKWIALCTACGIGGSFFVNYTALCLEDLLDRLQSGSLNWGFVLLYISVMIAACLLSYLDEYPRRILESGIYLDLKLAAMKKLSKMDYSAYQTLGTGMLVQRIENGACAGRDILYEYYLRVLTELLPSMVFSVIFIGRIHGTVMAALLAGYAVVFLTSNLLLRFLYGIKEKILTNEEELNHLLVRGFMEMVVFRLNRHFRAELEKAGRSGSVIEKSKAKMRMIHEAFFTIFELLVIAVKAGIIIYAWQSGSLSVGAVVALIALVGNAYQPVAIFNVLFVQYKLDKTAYARFEAILDMPEERMLEAGVSCPPLQGAVTFENVSFSYGNREILKNYSCRIHPGEHIMLSGKSGAGKSTFIKLLAGLLKPQSGRICLDGLDLASLRLDTYYSQITYLTQETPLFDGSLRENLIFDREAPDEALIGALHKVQLQDWYDQLPDGLETQLGERGITMSGGERQRLALARLWFQPSQIVILDEATSALDPQTERKVLSAAAERLRGKTVVMIAHHTQIIEEEMATLSFS